MMVRLARADMRRAMALVMPVPPAGLGCFIAAAIRRSRATMPAAAVRRAARPHLETPGYGLVNRPGFAGDELRLV